MRVYFYSKKIIYKRSRLLKERLPEPTDFDFEDLKPLLKFTSFWAGFLNKTFIHSKTDNTLLLESWTQVAKNCMERLSIRQILRSLLTNYGLPPTPSTLKKFPKRGTRNHKDLIHNLRILDFLYIWIKTQDKMWISQLREDYYSRENTEPL